MKAISTFLNLVLLAGASLLMLFLILSGATNSFPFDDFYWVRADTSAISGAYSESAWTYWGVCQYGDYSQCKLGPAYPISPVDNFGTSSGVPQDFIDNRDTFFYLTRFSFVFILLGFCFTAFAFVIDILGFCFLVIDKVVVGLVVLSLLFIMGAAAMQTAANVMARNAFTSTGVSSSVGVKSMALLWASVACMLCVFFLTCAANIVNSYKKHIQNVRDTEYQNSSRYYKSENTVDNGVINDESSFTRAAPVEKEDATESGGIRFFRIKRNQKTSDEESV